MDAVRESALRRELDDLREQWPDLGTWRLVINGRMRSYFGRCYDGRREIHQECGPWTGLAAVGASSRGRAEGCGSQDAWAKGPAAKDVPKWIVTCRRCGAGVPRRRRSAGWQELRHRGCGARLNWMDMTCNDCAARQYPLPGELGDEPSRKPQDTSQHRFLPSAMAPSGPLEPTE